MATTNDRDGNTIEQLRPRALIVTNLQLQLLYVSVMEKLRLLNIDVHDGELTADEAYAEYCKAELEDLGDYLATVIGPEKQ